MLPTHIHTSSKPVRRMLALVLSTVAIVHSLTAGARELELLLDDWPPFHYQNNDGDFTGFATEVMRKVLTQMQLAHTMRMEPFTRALYAVKQGRVDGSFTSTREKQREVFSYFTTESIVTVRWVFFTRKHHDYPRPFTSYKSLQGHRIGIVRSYTYTKEFWHYLNLYEVPSTVVNYDTQNFKKLAANRVDFVPAVLENGLFLIDQLGLSGEVVPIDNFVIKKTDLYAIWSKKRVSKAFVEEFSAALKAFKQSRDYADLYQTYFYQADAAQPSPGVTHSSTEAPSRIP